VPIARRFGLFGDTFKPVPRAFGTAEFVLIVISEQRLSRDAPLGALPQWLTALLIY